MTTKLSLLLDENIANALADLIKEFSGLMSVKYVHDIPGFDGTDDPPLVEYATKEGRILVTVDTGINHRSYRPCTHSGILRITTRNKHAAIQGGVLKRFFQSGHRAKVKDAVCYVSDGKAEIHSHSGEETVDF